MISKAYLDHHTATRPFSSSIEAMLPFFKDQWGSTTSPHQMGQDLSSLLRQGVEEILEILGARKGDRFYFFSSYADAVSYVFLTHYFDTIRKTGKNHLLTTPLEEAPIGMSLKKLEEVGCFSKILSVNAQGQLTQDLLNQALKPRTSLLTLSWANGLTGVIHPIADLAAAAQRKDVRVHVDASYVIGKLYFRLQDLPIDFLTFEGSLIHAPRGTAGLIVKENTPLSPPLSSLLGLPVGNILALQVALEENAHLLDHMCLETTRLRDRLETEILKRLPESSVFFQQVERLPNCSVIAFPGVSSEALLFLLHRKGVCASLGGGQCQKLSHLLIASGIDERLAQCALSFSLSHETTEEEVDYAIKTVVECVKKLQDLSGNLWPFSVKK